MAVRRCPRVRLCWRDMKSVLVAALLFSSTIMACAQRGRWADANDASAKSMIELERRWAETTCDHNDVAKTMLAEDFQGTSTKGKRFDKREEVADTTDAKRVAGTDCKLGETRVRFFGDNLALIYGAESFRKPDGSGQKQVWTDTWMKRDGKWQVVASQDTIVP